MAVRDILRAPAVPPTRAIQLLDDTRHQLLWFDDLRVGPPLQDPRNNWKEVCACEREAHGSAGNAQQFLRWVPNATGDELGLFGRKLDDHTASVRRVADVNSERTVEHLVDLEVRGDLECELAQVLGFHEPLYREHAKTSPPVVQVGGCISLAQARPDDVELPADTSG